MALIDYSTPGFLSGVSEGEEAAGWAKTSGLMDLVDIAGKHSQLKIQSIQQNFATVSELISLGAEAYGGFKAHRKMKYQTMPGVQEYFAKLEYADVSGPTTSEGLQPKVPWADLDEAAKSKFLEKYTPSVKDQSFWEGLMGEEKIYKFGEHEVSSSEMTTIDLARKFGMDYDIDISQFDSKHKIPSIWEEWFGTNDDKKTTLPKVGTGKIGTEEPPTLDSFNAAFAAARKAGKKTFMWNGKSYTTNLKEE